MNRRDFLKQTAAFSAGLGFLSTGCTTNAIKPNPAQQPNILWLVIEDYSPHLGCYGVTEARTPVLDKFAETGVRYNIAWATASVCAVNRNSILTGVYSTTLGAHQMRNRSKFPSELSEKTYPELMSQAGYYCTNPGKTDYQFSTPSKNVIWNDASPKAHYRNRPDKSQPFLHVVNFVSTHQGYNEADDTGSFDPKKLPLPPYYPDTERTRRVFATYFNNLTQVESEIAEVLQTLEDEGEKENTIVFFYSDHGAGSPRAKWWAYDSGLREPFIIHIPEKFRVDGQGMPGTASDIMISNLDLAPTVLNLAGVDIPDIMQGQPFLGKNIPKKRQYLYASSDRQGASHDIVRSVRNEQYIYLRNYEYWKPTYKYAHFHEGAIMRAIRKGYAEGTLTPLQAKYLDVPKPIEELYDLKNDPHETINLATSPQYQEILKELRKAHQKWRKTTRDLGVFPEGILTEERENYTSEYELGMTEAHRIEKLWETLESLPVKPEKELIALLQSDDQVQRYWAAIGLGNLESHSPKTVKTLEAALADDSPYVQVVAARGLLLHNTHQRALNVLQLHLKNQDALGVATALTYNDAGSNAKAHEKVLQERLKGSFSRSEPGKRMKDNIRVALKTINDKPIIPIIK